MTVPDGVKGRVLETRTLFEATLYNKQVECSESVGSVYVFLVQKRKVQVGDKIAQAQQLHDDAMAAHDSGDHAKSEELLNDALELFKS